MSPNAALRLLLLLPYAPRLDAAHGGGRVMAQFVEAMATRHRLRLVCLRGAGEADVDDALLDRCEGVDQIERPWSGCSVLQRAIRLLRLLAGLAAGRPLWVSDWRSAAYARRAREIVAACQPDVVQMEYHVMGQYLPSLTVSAAPRVLTEYEPGICAAPFLKQLPRSINSRLHELDRRAWRRYEPALIGQVDSVVVFTERDRATVAQYGLSTPVRIILPGVRIPDHPLNPLGGDPPSVLFVGSFVHPPNLDAALRLARDIFPALRRQHPSLRLYIAGDQPPAELQRLASDDIVVTGRVPDVAPYLDRASLFVAPLRLGGGVRVKVQEALANGKAVLATRLAAEGLPIQDGEEIALAETDQEFVERAAGLLEDHQARAAMAQRGRQWACDHLSWRRAIDEYDALYEAVRAASRRRA